MKKNFFSMLVISALALAFVGCANPSSAGGSSYSANYAVGDIILNDGSKVNYKTAKNYTGNDLDELKAKAIAVIFRADTENNTALGVGLVHKTGYEWCTTFANAYSRQVGRIMCHVSGSAGNLTFRGDTDGSDNLEQIASFLATENDTAESGEYAAFIFAKHYNLRSHNLTSAYENGWYLPTVAELFDIWKVKATVDVAIGLCGGCQFGTLEYLSSSQYDMGPTQAFTLHFDTGGSDRINKQYLDISVCAVRAFN